MRLSGIHQEPVKKNNTAKKVVATTLGAAAATAGVLYLAKTGKLDAKEGGNRTVEAAKAALKKPADKILNSDKFAKISAKATELLGKGKAKVKAFANSDVVANAKKGIDTLKDKIEAKFHPEKFAK